MYLTINKHKQSKLQSHIHFQSHMQCRNKYTTVASDWTDWLTNSVEKGPSWEANRSSASQEIPSHFIELEGSSPHSQRPPTYPYLELDRSSPCPTSNFPKIRFNIILPSMYGPSKWSPSLRFSHLASTPSIHEKHLWIYTALHSVAYQKIGEPPVITSNFMHFITISCKTLFLTPRQNPSAGPVLHETMSREFRSELQQDISNPEL